MADETDAGMEAPATGLAPEILDSRYLHLEVNQPFSHPEFSEKAFHSCTSNLLYHFVREAIVKSKQHYNFARFRK